MINNPCADLLTLIPLVFLPAGLPVPGCGGMDAVSRRYQWAIVRNALLAIVHYHEYKEIDKLLLKLFFDRFADSRTL